MANQPLTSALKAIPLYSKKSPLTTYLEYRRDPIGYFTDVTKECGGIAHFQLGPIKAVFLNSPELIQSFLVEHAQDYDKSKFQRNLFSPLTGNGLLTSEGQYHTQQRKLMAPAFTPRRLEHYAEAMVACADQAQQRWDDGAILNLDSEMMSLTMSIVSKVLLNTEFGDTGETKELAAAINIGQQWIRYATTGLFPLPLSVPTPRNQNAKKAMALVRNRVQAIIDERRASLTDRGDLLSTLLMTQDEQGKGMNDQQVFDEVITIFLAGYETTGRALSWTIYLLNHHPEIYAKMQVECDRVLAGRMPTYADLPNLPYTLQVLKESMRLYPPSSVIFRQALKDTEIEGYPIKKGTMVIFSQYVLHRHAESFPDPNRFDPERFSPENEAKIHKYAYLPFGAGHRICIGNHFASLEGQLILAVLSQKVNLELLSKEPVQSELVVSLRPKTPLKVKVTCREAVPSIA
jgi:cytochrome P450